jgi:hypothetical protein
MENSGRLMVIRDEMVRLLKREKIKSAAEAARIG